MIKNGVGFFVNYLPRDSEWKATLFLHHMQMTICPENPHTYNKKKLLLSFIYKNEGEMEKNSLHKACSI